MRLTDVDGKRWWINPMRVDSVKEAIVGDGQGNQVPGVVVTTPNRSLSTYDDFETLTRQLDKERGTYPAKGKL